MEEILRHIKSLIENNPILKVNVTDDFILSDGSLSKHGSLFIEYNNREIVCEIGIISDQIRFINTDGITIHIPLSDPKCFEKTVSIIETNPKIEN